MQSTYDPSIPTLSHSLIGREGEMTRLRQRLQGQGNTALTALNGLPGVGKTTLLIALAHDPALRAHFSGGILWAGLGPTPNLQHHLSRWGALLGLSQAEMSTFQDEVDWAVALRRAISDRALLLVIDDAWTLPDALALLVGGRNCAHLLTTRFPAIAAEVAADGATAIEELSNEEGLALLRQLAPEVVESEGQRAHELVTAVGGLPLALALIGNYLRLQPLADQAGRISVALQKLSSSSERLSLSEPRGPVELHPSQANEPLISLSTVIAVTDQQLAELPRHALHALSVFPAKPNSFSEEAALAVAGCETDILDELADSGLLEINNASRYTLHQTIADYARLHLSDSGPRERLVAYMTTFVEQHPKQYEQLEGESSNIFAALDAIIEQGIREDLLPRLVIAIAPFLLVRSLDTLAESYLQQAYDAGMTRQDTQGLAKTLRYLGELSWKRRQSEQAETYLREGLKYARIAGQGESGILAKLGTVAWKSGDYAQAEICLQEGLSLARQAGDLEEVSEILSIFGSVAMRQGHYDQAEIYLQEGLSLARRLGARERMCPLLTNLGLMTAEQDRAEEAEGHYHEALVLARQLRHTEWISLILNNLGDLKSSRGEYDQAEIHLQEGLDVARGGGSPEWTSFLLLNLGAVACKQENYPAAEEALVESLLLARQTGVPLTISHALYEYGNLHLALRQSEQAAAIFREMQATVPEGSQDLQALAQYGLARVCAMQGQRSEALLLGEASVHVLEAIASVRNAGEVRAWLKSI